MSQTICITGGSGFVGKYLINELKKRGYKIKVIDLINSTDFIDGIKYFKGSILNISDLEKAIYGSDVVIHLAAAIGIADSQLVFDTSYYGAINVVKNSEKYGVKKIIAFSTVSSLKEKTGAYGDSKFMSEEIFLNSSIPSVILRPDLIYGKHSNHPFKTMIKYINALPFIPVIGSGEIRMQPVFIDDVIRVTMRFLDMDASQYGNAFNVAGPEILSFNSILDKLSIIMCDKKKKRIHLSLFISKLLAMFLGIIFKKPPITIDNVIGATQDALSDLSPLKSKINYNPIYFDEGLKLTFS